MKQTAKNYYASSRVNISK